MLYRKGPSNDRWGGLPIVQSGPHRGHEIAKLGFTSTPIANHYMVYGTQITIVYSTMWGPQTIAKLVDNPNVTLVYGIHKYSM